MSATSFENLDAQLGDVDRYPIDMVIEVADDGAKMYRFGVNQSVVCAQLTVLGDAMATDMKEGKAKVVTIGADFADAFCVQKLLECVYADEWDESLGAMRTLTIYRLAHMYGGALSVPYLLAALAVEKQLDYGLNFWEVVELAGTFGDRRTLAACVKWATTGGYFKPVMMKPKEWSKRLKGLAGDDVVRVLAAITQYAAKR